MTIHFTKMQGAGNDFIILDNRTGQLSHFSLPALAASLCRRRQSIGADGMMVIGSGDKTCDCSMDFYNADGSIGEMCGNGARCLVRFCLTHGLTSDSDKVRIKTSSGMVTGYPFRDTMYTVRLSDPHVYLPELTLTAENQSWHCAYMELGSPGLPHLVLPLPPCNTEPIPTAAESPLPFLRPLAQALRSHPALPKGANVNFYSLNPDQSVSLFTYERGVEDFTLACGTGAGCTGAVLASQGLLPPEKILIHTLGGDLTISLTLSCDTASVSDHACKIHSPVRACDLHNILLTGPALFVAEGQILPDSLTGL